jgi:hypothetical protein
MALSMQYTTVQGIELPAAYIKIDEQSGIEKIYIRVSYYASRGHRLDGKAWLEQEVYSFVPSVADDAPNFIKQGYEYLKTLDKFKVAIDVLE